MTTAILIILAFGILVFIHEFGHFIAAKILKIKVLQFSFGLGKEIIGKTIGETRYSLCVLPVGGAVRLKGENIEELDLQEDSFFGKKWYQRIFVAAMGPIMNYVLAVIIFIFLAYFFGIATFTGEPVIGEVLEGKPAYTAGIKPKDRILKINDKEIKTWSEMAEIINNSVDKRLTLEILREGKTLKIEVVPQKDETTNRGIIGITPGYEIKKVGFLESVKIGFFQPIFLSIYSIQYLIDRIIKLQKPEVAGPVGIIQILSKSAKSGIESFLYTIATISTMLGLFNLFPIPILDGGHILFSFVEGFITKKIPSKKAFEIANFIGLSIILFLFFFATYSDFLRIFYKK
jgi:regulator of sigma E protease